ncbi:RDD family protein, partial [Cellulomonas sp.]|uniref:RDD family protein n=1 Tax=Cellulomonas sp. TaxID=40001 RepID=UPI002D512706
LVLLQAYTGATPGKRVAGVAVVRADTGAPAGLLRTLARPFVHVVDGILLIGYLRPLWHPMRRTVADSVLGTVAVLTRGPAWLPGLEPVPRASRGSAAVTAAAIAVCAASAVLAVPTSSSGSVGTVGDPVACVVEVPGGVPDVGAAATVQRTRTENAERRAWVVRELAPSGPGFDVAWTWSGSLGRGDAEAWVEARVSPGAGAAEPTLIEEPHAPAGPGPGEAFLSASPDAFTGLTRDGWVETSLVVDGRAVATCRVPGAELLDG